MMSTNRLEPRRGVTSSSCAAPTELIGSHDTPPQGSRPRLNSVGPTGLTARTRSRLTVPASPLHHRYLQPLRGQNHVHTHPHLRRVAHESEVLLQPLLAVHAIMREHHAPRRHPVQARLQNLQVHAIALPPGPIG